MDPQSLVAIADQIAAEPLYDAALCQTAFEGAQAHLPEVDEVMTRNGALGGTDAVLTVIDHGQNGWAISLQGSASEVNGHWTCSLRRQVGRDDDPAIGVAKGPKLSNVMVAALLKALTRKNLS